MRSQELALTQTRNANLRDLNQAETDLAKARRQYELQKPLAEQGLRRRSKAFNDTQDDLSYQQQRLADPASSSIAADRSAADRASWRSCAPPPARSTAAWASPAAASASSTSARRSPASSAASTSSSASRCSRASGIGQIDSAGGNKLQADVDEFYLGRVAVGPDRDRRRRRQDLPAQGRQGLSAGPQRPVPDRPRVRRRRADRRSSAARPSRPS